jgi:hypothetical protein
VVDTPAGSRVLNAGSPAWNTVMFKRMNDRVEQFTATGAKVILLLEPPEVHTGGLDATDRHYEQMNALLKKVAAEHRHDVATVDLQSRVCPGGPPCPYVVDGMGSENARDTLRPDTAHYLPAGALWVAKWLVPRVAASAKGLGISS